MAPTLPVRAGSGRADGGNGVTIGRIGSVIEHECGLEMILASPDDLPPTAANPDEVGDLEQYLDAADVAVVGVLHAFKAATSSISSPILNDGAGRILFPPCWCLAARTSTSMPGIRRTC